MLGEQLDADADGVVGVGERVAAGDDGRAVGEIGDGDVDGTGAGAVGLEDKLKGDGLIARGEDADRGAVPDGVIPAACRQGMGQIVLEDFLSVVHGPDRGEVSGRRQNGEQQNDAQRTCNPELPHLLHLRSSSRGMAQGGPARGPDCTLL